MIDPLGIFCFEGDWGNRLDDTTSVRPLLETMNRVVGVNYIHRRIGTKSELYYYVDRWLDDDLAAYRVGHFAFHGEDSALCVNDERVTLRGLGRKIGNRAEGRIIYFDACDTLNVDDSELDGFLSNTGADAVIGNAANVDWMESAAFDLLLFYALSHHPTMGDAKNWLEDAHGGLGSRLELRFRHS